MLCNTHKALLRKAAAADMQDEFQKHRRLEIDKSCLEFERRRS